MCGRGCLVWMFAAFALLAVVMLTGGGMGYSMDYWMMRPWMGNGWGMGWGLMGLGMVVFWIVIGLGVFFLMAGYRRPWREDGDRALAIARERYARGEITQEEFEKVRRALSTT